MSAWKSKSKSLHWKSPACIKKRLSKIKINYAGSENHSPHKLRKRSHFGTEYRKAPPPQKGKENQWGSRGLQAWPETGF
jgi:hypothetical protein